MTFQFRLGSAALGMLCMAIATVSGLPSAEAARSDIVLGVRLEPPHLDPTAGAAAAIDEVVYANVFEGLTRIDKEGAVIPGLAESWTISDDGKIYTFKLRPGVSFHDGSAFDANDTKFSLDRARAENSTNAQKPLFAAIESVKVVDPLTLEITLKKPTGNFLFNLGWGDAIMVSPETAEGNKTDPVGTGPFKFSKWVKGDRIEIERNPEYWGEQAKLDKATFKVIADPAAALASLMAGDVDAFPIYPAPENLSQLEADPRFAVAVGSTEGETILAMNNKSGPLADKNVRKAISHAIDKKAIIDGAMFGYGTPIGSHFAPHHPAYNDLTGTYEYDLEKARNLLAEAGYPKGFSAVIKLPPPAYARRGGEIAASQLRKIGVELEIVPLEWAQWLKEVFKEKNYDFTIVSHTEPMDIGIYSRPDYYFQYQNPEFNELITKLEETTDTEERYKILADAQKVIADDAVNVFMFQLAKTGVANADVEGLWLNAPIQANDLTSVKWK